MPITFGPDYFGTVLSINGPWWNDAFNAENAPNGVYTTYNADGDGNQNALQCSNWFTSLPSDSIPIANVIIEFYGFSASQPARPFTTVVNLTNGQSVSQTTNITIPTSIQWFTVNNIAFGQSPLKTINLFLNATTSIRATAIPLVFVDSIRMTIICNNNYFGGEMYSKKIRQFKMSHNRRTRIISQSKFKGAA